MLSQPDPIYKVAYPLRSFKLALPGYFAPYSTQKVNDFMRFRDFSCNLWSADEKVCREKTLWGRRPSGRGAAGRAD